MTSTISPYIIAGIMLQSPRLGQAIDLVGMFVSCDIFEDLDKPYITADLILNDDKSWYESTDIIGGETITLMIRSNRDKIDNSEVTLIKKTFYIHYVSVQHRVSEHQQILMLHLIEDVGYVSNLQNVNLPYEGRGEDIIKNIAEDFLILEKPNGNFTGTTSRAKEVLYTNPSGVGDRKNYKLIVPNLNPLRAMKWICNNMVNQNGSPFYLFSTFVGDKIILAHLQDLIQTPALNRESEPFIFSPSTATSPPDIESTRAIMNMKIGQSEDLFKLIKNGNVGASYTIINGAAPNATTEVEFDFDLRKDTLEPYLEFHLPENSRQKDPAYSPRFTYQGTPFNELKSRNITLFGGSNPYRETTLPDDETGEYPLALGEGYNAADYKMFVIAKSFDALFRKNPLTINLNGIEFINGDRHTTIGNSIHVQFQKSDDQRPRGEKIAAPLDRKLSGKYLIYRARHILKREKYDMSFTLAKLTNINEGGD